MFLRSSVTGPATDTFHLGNPQCYKEYTGYNFYSMLIKSRFEQLSKVSETFTLSKC